MRVNFTLSRDYLICRRHSPLFTDLYQLTMAYGYWKSGKHEMEATFSLFFREHPFRGGFSLTCGLSDVLEFVNHYHFENEEIDYLRTLNGSDGSPLFDEEFLMYLRKLRLVCDIDAIPEGSVVFPYEPLLRVQGPIIQCQLLETALLNIINFQSLIATKSARICLAAKGDPVLEFGLRRAQGINGGLTASRAAYIGGCSATSNVLAGKSYGIPVSGTHAHSWVMAFETEIDSFEAYARALPNNCVFLVDTFDTLEGVHNAVRVGRSLQKKGYKLLGIRLDSGDLSDLSYSAREILDDAGFVETLIIASNNLDEHLINSLKEKQVPIGLWGVGTKLVTGDGQSALGGVYKLTAIRDFSGSWKHKLKVSEESVKTSIPGVLEVRRFEKTGNFVGDLIYDLILGPSEEQVDIGPGGTTGLKTKPPLGALAQDLLVPVLRKGQPIYQNIKIEEIRNRAQQQLSKFHPEVKNLVNPDHYPVNLDFKLHKLRKNFLKRFD